MKTSKLNIIACIFIFCLLGLLSRSFYLAINEHQLSPLALLKPAASATKTSLPRPERYALLPNTQRGMIMDRNNYPLAYSSYLYNLYLNGREQLPLNESSVTRIAELIEINPAQLSAKLYNDRVTLLKRFADKSQAKLLYELKAPHFLTDRVLRRVYPNGTLLAHTLGFVGHDEHGLAGLEQYYEKHLSAFVGTATGENIRMKLAIDKQLQTQLAQKLQATVIAKTAEAGVIIVQDTKTRLIRALSIYPNFNPNHFTAAKPQQFRNIAISSIIEPGSIFKILFMAYLLENNPDLDLDATVHHCEGFYELPNGEVINCTDTHGDVSMNDIISYSCNAGMIALMEAVPKQEIRSYLANLGIGTATGIDLPGEERGILPPLIDWGLRTKATSVIGQGIGVTPLQLINTFTTVVTDGIRQVPRLVETLHYYEDSIPTHTSTLARRSRTRVLQAATTAKVRKLLSHSVSAASTGSAAQKGGYKKVFGKTSTSQIANTRTGGYYKNKYHSIFAGGYPASDPQFVVLVLIMNPTYDYHGGRSAAPLFAEILDDVMRSYQLNDERRHEHLIPATFALPTLQAAVSGGQTPQFTTASPLPSLSSTRSVPNFKGLSLRQTLNWLDTLILVNAQRDYHISYQLIGKGYVTQQIPPPTTDIDGNMQINLTFSVP